MGILTLVPMPYRIAAVLALVAAVFGYGYVKGLDHQKGIDDEKFAEIRATEDEQALHAGRVALDRQVAVGSIVDTYEAQRRDLSAYYAGKLRDAQAANHPGAVPADPLPAGIDAGAADPRSTAEYIELQTRCAETTLMLINLQKAARAVEEIK